MENIRHEVMASILNSLISKTTTIRQHHECCALRGNGWEKKHQTVHYVFEHSPYDLFAYHLLVMNEMQNQSLPRYKGMV